MDLRRISSRLAVGMGISVAWLTLSATAASAHAAVVSTSPTQSEVFPSGQGPAVVTVTFDEAVHATPASLSVYDAAGRSLPLQGLSNVFRARILARLPSLSDGTYVTTWRIVSDDGHREQGAFTFTVGRGGATANIGALLAIGSPGESVVLVYGFDRALAYAGTLAVLGGLLFVRWWWPSARRRRDIRRLLVASALLGAVATLLSVPLEAAYSSTNGFGSLANGTALHDVLSARYGQAALIRAGLLLATLPLILRVGGEGERRRRGPELVVALVALGVWGSYAYAGHGFSGRWVGLGFTTDIVHLASASLWFGGLVVLGVAVRRGRLTEGTGGAVASFSALALPAIGLLVLSGVIQGWRQVGSFTALFHTTYGHLLTIKVLIVIAVVIVASAGRGLVAKHVLPALRSTARPVQTALDEETHAARELRDGIWAEVVLALAVLGVTSALVFSAPAREAELASQNPSARTIQVQGAAAGLHYTVVAQPGLVGVNTIVVTPRLLQRGRFLPASLEGRLYGPDTRAARKVLFTPLDDGRWVASAMLGTSGTWRLTLIEGDGTSTSMLTLHIPIG